MASSILFRVMITQNTRLLPTSSSLLRSSKNTREFDKRSAKRSVRNKTVRALQSTCARGQERLRVSMSDAQQVQYCAVTPAGAMVVSPHGRCEVRWSLSGLRGAAEWWGTSKAPVGPRQSHDP